MNQPTFKSLLDEALSEPGIISQAYSQFWSYSIGNQLAAISQIRALGLELGPIGTLSSWNRLGRWVKKGSQGLWLCRPIKRTWVEKDPDGSERTVTGTTSFVWKKQWFTLSQTDGRTVPDNIEVPNAWNESSALASLGIARIKFEHIDGNTQGYASGKSIAINPVAQMPERTLFHELSHILLGHTEPNCRLPRELQEFEAEGSAYLILSILGIPGIPESRGYLQHWITNIKPTDRNYAAAFSAADKIIKAGRTNGPNL